MGNEEAERRRRMDEGMRSQRAGHFGRGPKGYTRSDQRILEDVSDRLTEDWHVDASEIEVVVVSAEVTLSGTVDSRDAKRRAENIAADVMGVKDVQNNLRVRQPQSFQSSGQGALTGSSSSALEQTTGVSSGAQTNSPATRPKH
jgi:osmotically-inducible protein OsmY